MKSNLLICGHHQVLIFLVIEMFETSLMWSEIYYKWFGSIWYGIMWFCRYMGDMWYSLTIIAFGLHILF